MRPVNHVLVVDDEPAIVEIVRDYLADAGYRVSTARSGEEALRQVRSIRPDLIVLDLGLPGLDGLDVARAIRQSRRIPIIMLTARADEADRVVGLELGADDYVVKPFSPRELLARVRAVLRRSSVADELELDADRPLVVGDLTVDPPRRLVTVGEQTIEVTASEFDLLARMAAAPGRVFTRGQLLEAIHGVAVDAGERAIDAHVKNLRRKIEADPHRPRRLVTVHGVGYRLADS
jgi:two-component system, OmpR family, alkaline phosphatase synthesis response regulator PhoP